MIGELTLPGAYHAPKKTSQHTNTERNQGNAYEFLMHITPPDDYLVGMSEIEKEFGIIHKES